MLAGQGASGDLAVFDVVQLEPHSTILFFLVFCGYPDVQNTVFRIKLSHLNYQYSGKVLSQWILPYRGITKTKKQIKAFLICPVTFLIILIIGVRKVMIVFFRDDSIV